MELSTRGLKLAGLDGSPVHVSSGEMEALASRIRGPLLGPGDEGWAEAISVWNGMVAKVPALVVQPLGAEDVAATVAFARERRLLLGVRCGGHHIAGLSVAEGGLTLDLSRMGGVRVDPEARLAHVGAGCRLGEVDRATQEHGLATVLGFVSDTGVAGLTLGGGLGYLTRRFGWTVDNLEEVQIVTADGEVRRASRDEHPDLFWAVRGGGGNFGVVTRFTFCLHPVGPTVLGGLVAWPFDRAAEVLPAYRELTGAAPRELSVWLVLMRAPPAPFVPPQWHGERVCSMAVCFSGDLDRADEVVAPIRAVGDPVLDVLGERPYVEVQSYLNATEPRGMHYYWKTGWVAELTDGLLDTTRELFATCPIPGADLGFLHLGGALNERPADDGAIGNRDTRYAIGIKGMWAPDDPGAAEYRAWVREAGKRIAPFSTGASYINFQTSDEGDDRIRATYASNLDRLVEVKGRWDPENLFRMNRNIRPEG